MAGGVDQHELVVAGQVGGDVAPAPAGLGEAVHQHEAIGAAVGPPVLGPDDLGVQRPGVGAGGGVGHEPQRRATTRARP